MNKEYFQIALKNLKARRLRSWLTMLGIIIGIAAVVGLISIGQGLQAAVEEEFQELGTDRILISPVGDRFISIGADVSDLTEDDVEHIKNTRGVKEAGYYRIKTAQFEWGQDDIGFYPVLGLQIDDSYEMMSSTLQLDIIEGRELRQGDRRRIIAGYDFANFQGFDSNVRSSGSMTINGERYQIAGINDRIGNEFDDRAVIMTMDGFKDLFDVGDSVDEIVVQVEPGLLPEEVVPVIEEDLRRKRGVSEGEEDFQVETFENIIGAFLDIFNVITVVIVGIAGISLIVGGVGIMNTMYTSVLERTRDIGVMKATGARNKDIKKIFLFESGLLGLIGGLIGLIIGMSFALGVEYLVVEILEQPLLSINFSPWLLTSALLFSFVIGMISGYLPARQASNLNPVDALRSE